MVSLSQPHRAAVYVNPYTREIMGRNKQFGFALHWTVMLLTAWAERLPALVCIRVSTGKRKYGAGLTPFMLVVEEVY